MLRPAGRLQVVRVRALELRLRRTFLEAGAFKCFSRSDDRGPRCKRESGGGGGKDKE